MIRITVVAYLIVVLQNHQCKMWRKIHALFTTDWKDQ